MKLRSKFKRIDQFRFQTSADGQGPLLSKRTGRLKVLSNTQMIVSRGGLSDIGDASKVSRSAGCIRSEKFDRARCGSF